MPVFKEVNYGKFLGMAERGGAYTICVRPTDVDRNGIRNMEKLAWLEFGAKGRAAVPVLKTAVLNAAPSVCEKMREVFRREAGR